MKIPGYYTSGEFARMAHVSVRTIRFYDKQNILKPSFVDDKGTRYYNQSDFARLQQILLLKYLGFSLEDIREMTIDDTDYHFMLNSLDMQHKLICDRIEQMQLVEQAIKDTTHAIQEDHDVDWSQMLNLIHLTNMETSLKSQYQNANNISTRIHLHHLYSQNKQGWFPWIYDQCQIRSGQKVLELGCGNGSLWSENQTRLPKRIKIVLSDISQGMLRDVRRALGATDKRFQFLDFDCHQIPFPDQTFDLVMANHVLFYCDNLQQVCQEVSRVLKPGGTFVCSTYGSHHMKEIDDLVQKFDPRIALSAEKLFERFGLDHGQEQLAPYFSHVEKRIYDDRLLVDAPEPLIEYILSCHGNQNQYILDRYREFRDFVEKQIQGNFPITKEAGVFVCKKTE